MCLVLFIESTKAPISMSLFEANTEVHLATEDHT